MNVALEAQLKVDSGVISRTIDSSDIFSLSISIERSGKGRSVREKGEEIIFSKDDCVGQTNEIRNTE